MKIGKCANFAAPLSLTIKRPQVVQDFTSTAILPVCLVGILRNMRVLTGVGGNDFGDDRLDQVPKVPGVGGGLQMNVDLVILLEIFEEVRN